MSDEIHSILKPRDRYAHKGAFGHGLLIAGTYGKTGAAVLAATACMKTGIGLLTVRVPADCVTILQSTIPEAMTDPDPHAKIFTTCPPDIKKYNAVGIGPGLGCDIYTLTAVIATILNLDQPLVLDADALNLISMADVLKKRLPAGCILTPHPKEFDRLCGKSDSAVERIDKALEFSAQNNCYIVLKGANTMICSPNGNYCFNPTGNPGMATAGSGDVLTGMILALLAQSYSPWEAARLGVYLHGLAGDIAAEKHSQESMIARDIIQCIGDAFLWIQSH